MLCCLSSLKKMRCRPKGLEVENMSEHKEIGKYISIIQRLNNAYFANQLSSYQIGCGQQFFL